MGALEPLFLLAGVVAAVPLFLHLFQRHETRRVAFPALRYLRRTERDHARRIRSRQLLLLLLRTAAILVLVAAGARLFVRGRGSAHPPTALALILDNSLSSGRIVGERRLLDHFRDVALRSLEAASDEDRVWVVRAGEPWQTLVPMGPVEARRVIRQTTVTEARGDLSASLARGAALVSNAGLAAREIHLISDLQATAFGDTVAPAGTVPVVVWSDPDETVDNHFLASVIIGGGLAPLVGQPTEITVQVGGSPGDTVPIPLRVVLGDQIRGAGVAPPGAAASIALPPAMAGWRRGYVESDPDALRADDRRYFAFQARPPPVVSEAGDPGLFVQQALGVLEAAGRIRLDVATRAELLVSGNGTGLDELPAGRSALVIPSSDANLLPALNRRLTEAGIPWRVERGEGTGTVPLEGDRLPDALAGGSVAQWYRLVPSDAPSEPTRTLARVDGEPWAVEGGDALGRRYLLLASPLDATSTSLPVSTAMVRFADWVSAEWATASGSGAEHPAGAPLPAPEGATRVRLPSGDEVPVDETRMVFSTGSAGVYTFVAGDSILSVVALNPDTSESDLAVLERSALNRVIGPGAVAVSREAAWSRAIFRTRQGPELWWGLLLAALALLLTEATVAAAGPSAARSRGTRAEERA
ncbi:MAG: BatA domain-containing protein [Gemmatimonadetes bacterium]|nr:BatA domain-containing protein [Gemmatimonadota bacterium]